MTTPAKPQQVQQVAQQQSALQNSALRDLAMQLNKPQIAVEPATFRKGIVTATNFTGNPPTVSVQLSGDTTTTINGVRFWDSVTPDVGQTVILCKQGSDLIVVAHVADTASVWTKATLAGSFGHDGDNQGDVEYRKVLDHGQWKIQWRGGLACNSGTVIVNQMPTGFRPSVKRKVPAARSNSSGVPSCFIAFQISGEVTLEGHNYTLSSGSHTHALGTSGGGGDKHEHSHGGAVSTTSFVETHTHALGSSSSNGADIVISYPNWVSFNNVEYFL